MTLAQLQVLKTEITTDPTGLGYAAASGDIAVAAILNLKRATIQIRRADITGGEILAAVNVEADVVKASANANTQAQSIDQWRQIWFQTVCLMPAIRLLNDDGTNTQVRTVMLAIITAGSPSLTRLQALQNRDGSRAEQLFGPGTLIDYNDVGAARQV